MQELLYNIQLKGEMQKLDQHNKTNEDKVSHFFLVILILSCLKTEMNLYIFKFLHQKTKHAYGKREHKRPLAQKSK
uniref:Uncharacterized protein n=1 Tax=Arion vulgaris TaxID=1028688 RepID=A0A0B6Z6K0_9EUPU